HPFPTRRSSDLPANSPGKDAIGREAQPPTEGDDCQDKPKIDEEHRLAPPFSRSERTTNVRGGQGFSAGMTNAARRQGPKATSGYRGSFATAVRQTSGSPSWTALSAPTFSRSRPKSNRRSSSLLSNLPPTISIFSGLRMKRSQASFLRQARPSLRISHLIVSPAICITRVGPSPPPCSWHEGARF